MKGCLGGSGFRGTIVQGFGPFGVSSFHGRRCRLNARGFDCSSTKSTK